MKKTYALPLAAALGLALTGCEQLGLGADKPAGEPYIVVDGYTVTQEQFQFHLQRRTQGQAQNVSQDDIKMLQEEVVDLALLANEAKQRGLQDKPEVSARIENLRNAVLAQALVEQLQSEEVSEEDLRAAYDKHFAGSDQVEYRARHILVEDEEKARQLIEQLNAEGDFAELAKEHSTGPTGERGGDLGWFQAEQMVPEFSNAVSELEPGEVTAEPVKTRFGWHVIKLEETRPIQPPEFEQVKNELRQVVISQRVETALENLRNQADIEYKQAAKAKPVTQQPAAEEQAASDDAQPDETATKAEEEQEAAE